MNKRVLPLLFLLLATHARAAELVCDGAAELPCRFGFEPLDVTPVPPGLDVQARLVRAGAPVDDGVLSTVVARLLHGTTLICQETHANVPVQDSIVNLQVGVEESGCFARAITERSSLALQLCIDGGTACMKPMTLGVAPSALKVSFAHTVSTASRAEVAYYANHALRLTGDRDSLVRRAIGTGYFDPTRPTDTQLAGVLDSAAITALGDGGFLSWVPTGDPSARTMTFGAMSPESTLMTLADAHFGLQAARTVVVGGLEVGHPGRPGWMFVGFPEAAPNFLIRGTTVIDSYLSSYAPITVGTGGVSVLGTHRSDSLTASGHWLVNAGLDLPSATAQATAATASLRATTIEGFVDVATGELVVDDRTVASGGVTVGQGLELVGPSGEVVTIAVVPIPGTSDYELQLDPIRATARVSLELPTVFEKPVAFLNEATFEDPKTAYRCAHGFALTQSATGQKACVDENECFGPDNQPPNNLCPEANRTCVNRRRSTELEPIPPTDPGYTCECAVGWVADASGTCVAENECTTGRPERRHTCAPQLVCQDRAPGQGDDGRGYACVCPAGQMRSGDSCIPVDECSYVGHQNVAIGKPATMSTTYEAGKSTAGLASDGNTSGIYPIAHTVLELEPWWQVDLQQPYAIERVVVWRRTDCCSERLNNVDVKLSMGDPTMAASTVVGAIGVPTAVATTVELGGARGRYLRLQMRNTGNTRHLELGEVQIFVRQAALAPTGITASCAVQSECVDTATGFDCTCWPGYTKSGAGASTSCTDADECATGAAQCPASSTCQNVPPGIAGACPPRTICKAPPGATATAGVGYRCACANGFVVSADGNSCVDVNECASPVCGAGGTCTNQAGGYACSCAPGYRLTGPLSYAADGRATGLTCVAINECAEGNPCGAGGAMCFDQTPGYSCSCLGGYRVTGALAYSGGTGPASGLQCTAINECAEGSPCGGGGQCVDQTPGYTCSCSQGYRLGGTLTWAGNGAGTGRTCQDINECAYTDCCQKFDHHCQSGTGSASKCKDAACTNTAGGASCYSYYDYGFWSIKCPNDRGYTDTFSDL